MKKLNTLILSLTVALGMLLGGSVSATADNELFSQGEIDAMLAPVALYPDSVLSHLLIAATYPLEVIQAARWSREHADLRGEDAVAAVDGFDWDPSVKALTAFPELLARMDEDLDWTQNLGDAFLLQEEELLASIQYLRDEAYSQGSLTSNEHVKVVREKEYIYIEPARSSVVYVPYYDPRVIYTRWRWASYPPYYWHRPSGFSVGMHFYWGPAYHVRPSFYFSSFHWATRRVVVVNHHHYYGQRRFTSARQVARFSDARHWRHDPVHRRGVSYRSAVPQSRLVENRSPALATPSAPGARSSIASSRSNRAVARSDQRQWAAERRSSSLDVSDSSRAAARASSRSDRVSSLRNSGQTRSSAAASRSSAAAGSSGRTITGTAPQRSGETRRSAAAQSRRGSESAAIRSRSGSAARSRSSADVQGALSGSRSATRAAGSASSRASAPTRSSSASDRTRRPAPSSSIAVPRSLQPSATTRPSTSGSGSAASRSAGSSASRSRSVSPSSSPAAPATRSAPSAPTRSSRPSTSRPATSARSSSPSTTRSASSSRSSAPSRSSRSAAPRTRSSSSASSSRSSASSRSRVRDR